MSPPASALGLVLSLSLLAPAPCIGQGLPDPGRRLTPEELRGETPKSGVEPAVDAAARKPQARRDPQACERARSSFQAMCGAPNSPRSRSIECAEAYAMYQQSCWSE